MTTTTAADALRARLLGADSVTGAMALWCAERGIGALPLRSEVHVRAREAAPPAIFAAEAAGGRVFFRRITLRAGPVPLLEAENWFLPDRLPAAAVTALQSGDTPFGAALAPGRQTRHSTAALIPPGARPVPGARVDPRVPVLVLRGIVALDGRPVAFVEERIRPEALG